MIAHKVIDKVDLCYFFFFFLSDGGITRRYTYVSFYIKIFFTDAKYVSLCKINLSTLHFEVFV